MKNKKDIILAVCEITAPIILGIGFRCINGYRFERKLDKIGLHKTEVQYIYENKDGEQYYCRPAVGNRSEVITKLE